MLSRAKEIAPRGKNIWGHGFIVERLDTFLVQYPFLGEGAIVLKIFHNSIFDHKLITLSTIRDMDLGPITF